MKLDRRAMKLLIFRLPNLGINLIKMMANERSAYKKNPAPNAPSMSSQPSSSGEILVAGLISFLLPFAVYVNGAMPGLAIEGDSGEIITALYEFGILHSPGFPGYMVLAKTWTTLLGFLDIALATNLFSGFCGALGSYMVFRIGRRFDLCWSALALALAFAFSAEFWYASIAAEVYSLAVLSLLVITEGLIALNPQRPRTALIFGLLLGLGFSIHVYTWAMIPVFGYFAFRRIWPSQARIQLLTKGLTGFALGLFPYLYIPLRAGRAAHVNEGGINSFSRFVEHVTWIIQRERVEQATRLSTGQWLNVKLEQLKFFGGELVLQWGPLGLFLILALIALAVRSAWRQSSKWSVERRQFAYLSLISSVFLPVVIWLVFTGDSLNFGMLAEMAVHLQTMYAFLILSALTACWGFGQESRLAAILILLPIFLLALRGHDMNLSKNRIAVDHAQDLISRLAPGAVLLGDNDNDLMTITFEKAVHGQRPDVALLNLMNGTEWNYENYRRLYPNLPWPRYSKMYYGQLVPAAFVKHPIYFASWWGAIGYLETSGQKSKFQIVPIDGAFLLAESAVAHVNAVASENLEFRIFTTPTNFFLRPREVDVIASRAEYLLRQAQFLAHHRRPNEAKRIIALAFRLPTLNREKYGQALIQDLRKLQAQLSP